MTGDHLKFNKGTCGLAQKTWNQVHLSFPDNNLLDNFIFARQPYKKGEIKSSTSFFAQVPLVMGLLGRLEQTITELPGEE
ncbi:MAG: hypothetical protein J5654_12565 [Victivallales bacterium]|nr:hypothetical protein [Victivallales bacterium]